MVPRQAVHLSTVSGTLQASSHWFPGRPYICQPSVEHYRLAAIGSQAGRTFVNRQWNITGWQPLVPRQAVHLSTVSGTLQASRHWFPGRPYRCQPSVEHYRLAATGSQAGRTAVNRQWNITD